MNCKCGHDEKDHVSTLFGTKCEGRFWHDGSGYSCECVEFRLAEATPEVTEIPW